MHKHRRAAVILAIAIVCVSCDQAAKAVARETLAPSPPITVLDGTIKLIYSENLGAFLGLGADLPQGARFVLGVLVSALLLILAVALALGTAGITTPQLISLSFLIGGGIGNLIDRIWNSGAVVDFVVVSIGPLHTGIFNLADVAITFGALASMLFYAVDSISPQKDSHESVRSK
jgi:signal peptidase II